MSSASLLYKTSQLYSVNGAVVSNPSNYNIPTDEIDYVIPATKDGIATFLFIGGAGTLQQQYHVKQNSMSLSDLLADINTYAVNNSYKLITSIISIGSTPNPSTPSGLINTKKLSFVPKYDGTNTTFFISTSRVGVIKIIVTGDQTTISSDQAYYTSMTGIVAHAGGGQGSATPISAEYNNVTVVATAGDSVVLPVAVAGLRAFIKNNGASNLAVFPSTGGTIDGGSANASITLAPGTTRMFSAINGTDYESNQAIVTTSNIYTSTTGITAHSGGGQGSAVLLTTGYNNVTTVAAAGDSVLLPPAVAGQFFTVKNNGANNLAVFPSTSGTINGGSANASVTVLPGDTRTFSAINTTDFESTQAKPKTPSAINVTATATAAQMLGGTITSTSVAAVAITTPTAAAIAALLPNAGQGTTFDLNIDNSAGANTVTLTLDGSITAPVGAITGGNALTITTTEKVGIFRFYFTSPTAAVVFRIA